MNVLKSFSHPLEKGAPSSAAETVVKRARRILAPLLVACVSAVSGDAHAVGSKAACLAAAPKCVKTCDAVAAASSASEAKGAASLAVATEGGCKLAVVNAYIDSLSTAAPAPRREPDPAPRREQRDPFPAPEPLPRLVTCPDDVTRVTEGQESTCPPPTYGCDAKAHFVPKKDGKGEVVWADQKTRKAQCDCAEGFEDWQGKCNEVCPAPHRARLSDGTCVLTFLAAVEACSKQGMAAVEAQLAPPVPSVLGPDDTRVVNAGKPAIRSWRCAPLGEKPTLLAVLKAMRWWEWTGAGAALAFLVAARRLAAGLGRAVARRSKWRAFEDSLAAYNRVHGQLAELREQYDDAVADGRYTAAQRTAQAMDRMYAQAERLHAAAVAAKTACGDTKAEVSELPEFPDPALAPAPASADLPPAPPPFTLPAPPAGPPPPVARRPVSLTGTGSGGTPGAA